MWLRSGRTLSLVRHHEFMAKALAGSHDITSRAPHREAARQKHKAEGTRQQGKQTNKLPVHTACLALSKLFASSAPLMEPSRDPQLS